MPADQDRRVYLWITADTMADETKVAFGVPGLPPIAMPPEAMFWAALGNPTVPKLYANTFGIVVHPTDLALMFGQAGAIAGVVSLNYSVAKTLAAKLQEAISSYEKVTGLEVKSAEVFEKLVREKAPKS